jgi:hypothetical protein
LAGFHRNQGDQMRLLKNRPKYSPNRVLTKLLHNFYGGKKKLTKFVYFCNKKLPKVNNHPIGENSPNLVTLTGTLLSKGPNETYELVRLQIHGNLFFTFCVEQLVAESSCQCTYTISLPLLWNLVF